MERSQRSHLQGFNTVLQIIHRACRGRKVEDVVHRAGIVGLVDILLDELKSRVVSQLFNVAGVAGDEIVCANYLMTFRHQRITEMRADKTCAAGYQNSHEIPFDGSLLASSPDTFLVSGVTVIDAPLYGSALFVVVPS